MKLVDILRAALPAVRAIGPYALLELLMPGGTILAILLYLYRRRMQTSAGASQPAECPAACSSRQMEQRLMSKSRIAPCLWFNGEAEQAANFYVTLFPDSSIDSVSRYGGSDGTPVPFPKGTALMVEFTLAGQRFQALNGGPQFQHSEAISLSVSCRDAQEVDHYWNGLLANGGAESQCGWLRDRFGVSWQVVPEGLGALLSDPDRGRAGRALQAMLRMKKLDLAAMRKAADGA